MSQFPNDNGNRTVRIFLYVVGTLMIFMAIVLIVQAFGVVIPREVIIGLAVLATGIGILSGTR